MKALLDEMIPPAVAEQLRQRGHDVVAVAERPDLRSLPDRDLWAHARRQGRMLVTRDRADYLAIEREERAAGAAHAGLVLISSRFAEPGVGSLVKALDLFLSSESHAGLVHWL